MTELLLVFVVVPTINDKIAKHVLTMTVPKSPNTIKHNSIKDQHSIGIIM